METKNFIVRMPGDVHRKLKIHCAETDQSLQGVINKLLAEYVANLGKPKAKKA